MARGYTLKKPDPSIFKGWGFVLVLGTILAVLAMFHRGTLDATQVTQPADGASCQFEVTIDNLNVRSEPTLDGNAPVQTVSKGQVVQGTPVVQNGYRELEGGLWALDQHLALVPGSTCS
ncbi:hypothetical protein [Pseudonocardia sp.]|uniref:hypothetical protein n=1 Tax=Pseudonocardia sp. TaxID=60912 RepID=UPI003D118D1E